ncbi:MAG TPA: PAS domain S-box protein, partial [bacterium]
MDKTVMETKDVRVLVVEDNPEDFQILQVLFSKIKNRRYKLENVLNLSKALEALRRREHEVYLVDYQLGPDSGIDFLKEAAAANCAAPSILLTGYGNPELDLKAMSLGAADFLSKNDLNPVILERSVRYALEHKRVEESVRRQEEFFRAMIENAQDGVMLIDADGKTRYASPSIEWILGYTQQERIGQDLFSLIHPEDLRIAKDLFTQSFNSSDKVFKAEFRTKHKGGSWRLIEATGKSHEFKSPDFTGVVLNYRDITEQKKAEESLKKHEDQMRLAQKMDAIGRLAGGVAHDFNNLLSVIGGNAYFVISSMEKDNPQRVELGEIQKAVRHGAELTKQLLVFGQKQVSQPRPVNLNDLSVEMNKMFKRLIDATIHLSIIQEKDLRSILVDPGQMQQVILN